VDLAPELYVGIGLATHDRSHLGLGKRYDAVFYTVDLIVVHVGLLGALLTFGHVFNFPQHNLPCYESKQIV